MVSNKLPGIFIPICFYAKSFYRRKKNMQYVFSKYVRGSEKSLILICDQLHAYNLITMGECSSVDEALKKATRMGKNMQGMSFNVEKKFNNLENIRIVRWKEIAVEKGYIKLFVNLKKTVQQDGDLRNIVDKFVTLHVKKFRWKVDKRAVKWEKLYLLSEITMSIYTTEILGYPRELWETAPDPEFPDPIGYLYKNRHEFVKILIGKKSLVRRLEILEIPQNGI